MFRHSRWRIGRGTALGRSSQRPVALPSALLAAFLALLVPAVGCSNAPKPLPPPASGPDLPLQEHQLRDRVVAIVDEEAILLSDVEEVVGLGLVARQEGDTDATLRRRALEGIVNQQLRFQAAEQFGFGQVSVDQIEEQVERVRQRFPSAAAFHQRLEELGLSEEELGQLLARQLMVLTYVDERLGARVFVSLADIRSFYEEELVPQLRAQGQPVPPLEEVREEIRDVIKQRRLLEEVERWTRELRREADIQIFLDETLDELPPLRARLGPPA